MTSDALSNKAFRGGAKPNDFDESIKAVNQDQRDARAALSRLESQAKAAGNQPVERLIPGLEPLEHNCEPGDTDCIMAAVAAANDKRNSDSINQLLDRYDAIFKVLERYKNLMPDVAIAAQDLQLLGVEAAGMRAEQLTRAQTGGDRLSRPVLDAIADHLEAHIS